jgi:transcriptional regulator with XRE-family HTH domain
MTQLSDNLTALRELKGWTVPQVHIALNSAGHEVAFSTVAGWFNGSREVRSMKHLKALCEVLDTDMNTLTGDSIAVAEGKVEVQVQRELRDMDEAQKELVLALMRNMKGSQK